MSLLSSPPCGKAVSGPERRLARETKIAAVILSAASYHVSGQNRERLGRYSGHDGIQAIPGQEIPAARRIGVKP